MQPRTWYVLEIHSPSAETLLAVRSCETLDEAVTVARYLAIDRFRDQAVENLRVKIRLARPEETPEGKDGAECLWSLQSEQPTSSTNS